MELTQLLVAALGSGSSPGIGVTTLQPWRCRSGPQQTARRGASAQPVPLQAPTPSLEPQTRSTHPKPQICLWLPAQTGSCNR